LNDSDNRSALEQAAFHRSETSEELKQFAKAVLRAAGKERMDLKRAKALISAGEQKAAEIGVPMVLAVVDEGGNLTALHRMDGSLLAAFPSPRRRPLPPWLSGLLPRKRLPPFCQGSLSTGFSTPIPASSACLAAAYQSSLERTVSGRSEFPAEAQSRMYL